MTTPKEQPARVMHLSDLHFGWRFQPDKWDALKNKARELAPDLVVITGDLVNTPWHWMLARAQRELRALADDLNPAGTEPSSPEAPPAPRPPCEVWVIPGNHDTRITGLVPVQWLYGIACSGVVLAAALFLLGELRPPLPLWALRTVQSAAGLALIIGLTAFVLRLLVRVNLERAWGQEYFLTQPRRSKRVPIGVIPFDSSSEGVSWARGRIPSRSLSGIQGSLSKNEPVTWIAAVHHHPLPLPYDHRTERMMAMDNAGALLSELAQAGVRLILHGHKHHQHFARIVIDPADARSAEVAVLSAGSPTTNPGAFRHGFNLITVHDDRHVQISMYEAPPEGGFVEKCLLDLAPVEEQDRRRYRDDFKDLKISCERMLCIAEIDGFGDARFYREFRDVRTDRAVEELAGPYVAGTSRGFVEAFRAQSLSQWGPQVNLKVLERKALGRIEAAIRFPDSGLRQADRPIDFVLDFFANNAFALNRWQYQCMYPERGPEEKNEYIRFWVRRDLAVRELTLHVKFPEELPLPRRIDIRHGTKNDKEISWRALSSQCLVRIESQHIVQARLPYPLLNSVFEINWEPHENLYPEEGTEQEVDIRRALDLRRKFGLLEVDRLPEKLRAILASIETEARVPLGAGAERSYTVALFVFDEKEKTLRFLAGNYADNDPRRKGRYAFGLGLPGRAFKTAAPAAFRRPAYSPEERPWGYVFPDGGRVTDLNQVPEAVILAVPLAPRHAPDWPFAVLQLSTDDSNCPLKTANTESDRSVERFCRAVRELTGFFEDSLSGKP